MSFTYNFDHLLVVYMCKFEVSTIFHWFDCFHENLPSKMKICGKIWPGKPPKLLQMAFTCMIYFYYQHGFWHVFRQVHLKTQMFVHPTITNMAAPWSAMFRTSSHHFFSAYKGVLKDYYVSANQSVEMIHAICPQILQKAKQLALQNHKISD